MLRSGRQEIRYLRVPSLTPTLILTGVAVDSAIQMNLINPHNYETLIGVDDDVMARLTELAQPFVDDPNSILRRELGIDKEIASSSANGATSPGRRPRFGQPTKRSRPLAPRAPKGSLTPEEKFEQPILSVLAEAGGSLPIREAVAAVGERMESVLNEHDRFTDSKGVARWEKRVPFVRLRLVKRGLLDKDAPRGIWQLTDKGREALEQRVS